MKPRGDGGAADGRMPAQLGSCAGIALFPGGPAAGIRNEETPGRTRRPGVSGVWTILGLNQ